MDAFTNFLANNYIWFLIVAILMIFAMVGYLVDQKETKLGRKLRVKKEDQQVIDFTSVVQSKSSAPKDDSVLNLNNQTSLDTPAQPAANNGVVQQPVSTGSEVTPAQTTSTSIVMEPANPQATQSAPVAPAQPAAINTEVAQQPVPDSLDLDSGGLPSLEFQGSQSSSGGLPSLDFEGSQKN